VQPHGSTQGGWSTHGASPALVPNVTGAAQDEAALAVRLYNNPSEVRAFEGFVMHMHAAWLYMLHARFIRDGVDFRYRDRVNPRRFVKVDGDYKRWELARCAEQRSPDDANPGTEEPPVLHTATKPDRASTCPGRCKSRVGRRSELRPLLSNGCPKWKDPNRVIARIIDRVVDRAAKGDGFRGHSGLEPHI